MCCASAAPRWACRSARRWFSSTASCPKTLPIAANRPANWRRRCASCPHRGSAFSKTAPGCGTPRTPTPWPGGWRRVWQKAPVCRRFSRCRPTASFVHLPSRVEAGLRERGWLFYNFIGAGGARLMCGWDTAPETVDRLLATSATWRRDRPHERLALLSAVRRRFERQRFRRICRDSSAAPTAVSCIGTIRRRCWRRWSNTRSDRAGAQPRLGCGCVRADHRFSRTRRGSGGRRRARGQGRTGLDATAVTLIGVYPFARKHEVIIAYHVLAEGEIRSTRNSPNSG
jgi:hypothetical protein